MLLNLRRLRGCSILASDGSIGKANDFFFTDPTWIIRYLVVDTGWLFGRKVLISPEAIEALADAQDEITLNLTKNQIEKSPGLGTDLPISRQQEMELREYHSWSRYWDGDPATMAASPLVGSLQQDDVFEAPSDAAIDAIQPKPENSHLHSAHEVEGYDIQAKDGEIGHVEDLIVDDDAWAVRYFVVDTRNWLPGRKVLVAPDWAREIDWTKHSVRFDLSRDEIEMSPPYDPTTMIDRTYESSVHEHFRRRPYWMER